VGRGGKKRAAIATIRRPEVDLSLNEVRVVFESTSAFALAKSV